MTRARVTAGMAGLLACAAFAGVGAPASGQREERSGDRVQPPAELLREYPFEQGRLRSRERSRGRLSRRAVEPTGRPDNSSAVGDEGNRWPVAWLAIGAMALLAVLALIARRARRPRAAGRSGSEMEAPMEAVEQLPPDAEPTRPSPASPRSSPRFPRRAQRAPVANHYAVANQKGGVGKTTVSLVLGAAAARRGKRVLLVDLDPQASATSVLGFDANAQTSLADVIVDGSRGLREAVVPTSWGLDLVPAEPRLRSADIGMGRSDESVLGRELATVTDYDLVLIDCPPSLGRLTLEALTAVSHVLVVTEPTYLALRAMKELRDTLDSVADQQNPALELAGVVLNRVESTAEHKRSVAELEATFGPGVWTPHVPKRAILQDAMREGVPPQDLQTHSHYAGEIAEIFDRLVERFASMKPELAHRFPASGVKTVEPSAESPAASAESQALSEESQAVRKLRAYYQREYGPMSREDSLDLVCRIVEGSLYFTAHELKALEHAGLAYGYSLPRPADAPKPWPRGPTALAERAYRRLTVGS